MSLQGTYRDPFNTFSIYPGTSEFDNFFLEGGFGGFIGGALPKITPLFQFPMGKRSRPPIVPSSPVVSPVVISEIPSTVRPGSSPRGQISKEDDVWPEWSLEPILETRPGRIPDPYPGTEAAAESTVAERAIIPTTSPLPVDEENDMAAWDWGAAASGVIDILQGQSVGGNGRGGSGYVDPIEFWGQGGSATIPPRNVTVNTATGKVTPCRRRRQKKILTNANFDMLLRIGTLPRNENIRIALAKAL